MMKWGEKPEGNTELKIPRRWWANNIRMDVGQAEWGGMDWLRLVRDKYQ
jgi:hypothetical protein